MKNNLILSFIFSLSIYACSQAQVKPNILWIVTDDQRVDSNGFYNEIVTGEKNSPLGYVSSPNLDRLAKEGIVFTNMYCNSPACAPSRSSIISGKYPHHSGVYGFEYFNAETDFFDKTLPQVMGENGYETSLFGKAGYRNKSIKKNVKNEFKGFYEKYILDTELSRAGHTDWYNPSIFGKVNGRPAKIDARTEFFYPNGEKKSWSRQKNISEEELKIKRQVEKELDILYAYTKESKDLIIGGVSPMPANKTLDANILTEYISYLENENKTYQTLQGYPMEGATTNKPIFTSLSFHFPHTPVMPPKEFRALFTEKTYRIPSFNKEKELSKLPKQLVDLYTKLKIDGLTYEEKQQAIRDYYAFCAYGDYLIGKAITAFKTYCKKNKQEYVILYTSGDHGWQLGEQGIESKFSPWEIATHTTGILVASDKKIIPEHKIYKGLVEYVDIMPTILAAGGIDLKTAELKFLDGYNLADVCINKKNERDYIIGEINSVAGPRTYLRSKNFAFSMRPRPLNGNPGGRYVPNENIKWGLDAPREEVQMALYDLRNDPLEQNNIANDKKYMALADWFRIKLGAIVLGDGRIESNWKNKNDYKVSNFAKGSHDRKLDIPKNIIPKAK
ncbi:sulfatase-like hydrolase/transferase [Cellulophaga sp. Z1A5H]|uniref:sulfatase-like hydrolase/transferase n=1 Tax=Cellulophaga sp. Z1A5H TaxID=2687291 RepID=UPI0013FE3680|nr:sulfatase-like hydrolase/transferase [Cellulophaga sp. Z1A5H]